MTTLVLAAHVPPVAFANHGGSGPAPVEIRAFVEPGLSSSYHALAARLRRGGRVLPGLLAHAGASAELGGYDRVVFLSFSAGYALAEDLLGCPADAARLAGWVALDSGYGEPTPGVVDLARRAREGGALYWAGFTDVPTSGYRSTGEFLAEVERRAGAPRGLFRVDHWAHDPEAYEAAESKDAFWRNEHMGALRRGRAYLADALRALDGVADTRPRPADPRGPSRAAVLVLARAALDAGVREAPPRSNRGKEIDGYLRGCVRRGLPLGVLGVPWCAAFASWCLWRAAYGDGAAERARTFSCTARVESGDGPPVGWRAAVSELCADARGTGAWHEWGDGTRPAPGDVLVMGRHGQDPRHGGEGHAAIVEAEAEGGGLWAIGGNEGNAVRRTLRGTSSPADEAEPIVGWIDVG